jgi:hypothetical protein
LFLRHHNYGCVSWNVFVGFAGIWHFHGICVALLDYVTPTEVGVAVFVTPPGNTCFRCALYMVTMAYSVKQSFLLSSKTIIFPCLRLGDRDGGSIRAELKNPMHDKNFWQVPQWSDPSWTICNHWSPRAWLFVSL